MMLPRRLVMGEGSWVSMCAPTSRQRVNTVVRLTWMTYCAILSHQPRSLHCPKPQLRESSYLAEIRIWELMTWMSLLDARAIYENVNLVSILQNGGCESCNFGLRGEVCGVDGGFSAQGLDLGFCFCGSGISLGFCQLSLIYRRN